MCEARLSERLTKLVTAHKDELKARIIAAFTNLNKKTVGKAGKRFKSRLKAVVEANGEFSE